MATNQVPARGLSATLGHGASRRRILLVLAGLTTAVGLALGLSLVRSVGETTGPARAIVLTAHDISFNGTNPPLELAVGERVALTIVNSEQQVVHDLVIAGLGIRTSYLPPGTSQTVVFTATKPGVFRYGCSLHPGLMDGKLVVRGG